MSRETKIIGDIGNTYTGLSGKTKDDFGHGDAQYITFLNVLNNPVIDTSIFEKVDVKAGEKQNRCRKGDLFFNTSSETPEEVGMCAYLAEDVPDLYLNSFCFGFHIKDKDVDGKYLSYYFRGKQGRKLMTMLAQGATRYNLSKENFMASEIELPLSDEQSRIATALYEIDTLIRNLDRTIEKKKNIRQGAIEQLVSGKKRLNGFGGEWTSVIVDEICNRYDNLRVPVAANLRKHGYTPYYGANGIQDYVDGYTHNGEFLLVAEDGANSLTNYPIHYVWGKIWVNNHAHVLQAKENIASTRFLVYAFKTIDFEANIVGSGRAKLNADTLMKLELVIPKNIEEQNAIASILTAMDDEIAVLQMERDKYANIRSGMMDDLLTGAKRL